jgi:tetratricopeptide (TPR) repeat protein
MTAMFKDLDLIDMGAHVTLRAWVEHRPRFEAMEIRCMLLTSMLGELSEDRRAELRRTVAELWYRCGAFYFAGYHLGGEKQLELLWKSIFLHQQACECDANSPAALNALGAALIAANLFERAHEPLERATRVGTDPAAWFHLAVVWWQRRKGASDTTETEQLFDEELTCYKRAIKLDPKHYWSRYNMAITYAERLDVHATYRALKDCIELDKTAVAKSLRTDDEDLPRLREIWQRADASYRKLFDTLCSQYGIPALAPSLAEGG